MNNLPHDSINCELHDLLQSSIEKYQKQKLETMMAALEDALKHIVGMKELKLQSSKWANGVSWDGKGRTIGINIPSL